MPFMVIERQLSPTKRTEKTGLEDVGLTASCPSVTGQLRPLEVSGKTGTAMSPLSSTQYTFPYPRPWSYLFNELQ